MLLVVGIRENFGRLETSGGGIGAEPAADSSCRGAVATDDGIDALAR